MIRLLVPVVILIVLGLGAWLIFDNPPETQRRGAPSGPQTVVEVVSTTRRPFAISVQSYGTVQPRTQSTLVAQVSGQIMAINPSFRPGGFFVSGDVLLQVDPRDYEANVKIAEATLMDGLQAKAQEEARSEQAGIDWQRLGGEDEKPSALVLRRPQLEAAKARVSSARSNLEKARLDLERTSVRAPFSGRVLSQLVDLGRVVNTGSQLAEVFATDYVEVRLPIRNTDLAFVDLPEGSEDPQPQVDFTSDLGGVVHWQGQIVRTEGAIDEVSRQLHAVAQINDPFARQERPLKIGEYVTATIAGRSIPDALVVPANSIYQNSYVYVVADGVLRRRDVQVVWQNESEAIVGSGLESGEQLVITPLGQVTSGTRVRIAGAPNLPGQRPNNPGMKGNFGGEGKPGQSPGQRPDRKSGQKSAQRQGVAR
jgi:RND family efflux transporter MFP subunit